MANLFPFYVSHILGTLFSFEIIQLFKHFNITKMFYFYLEGVLVILTVVSLPL